MSYTLHIWNPAATTPLAQTSLGEVADRLEELAQVPATEADRALFNELGKRLWQQYPSADESEAVDDIFEGNLPKDSLTVTNRLWTIGLSGGNRLRVLRDVAEHAKTLGLAVYDDQVGIAFDPKIGVIPRQRTSEWDDVLSGLHDEPETKIDKRYVRKQVLEPLLDRLVKVGFQLDKDESGVAELSRHFDHVKQIFRFILTTHSGRIVLSASFSSTILDLLRLSDMISEGKGGGGVSICPADYTSGGGFYEYFETQVQIDSYLDAFDNHMLPVVAQTQTVNCIDQLIYSPEGQKLLPKNFSFLRNTPSLSAAFAKCGIAGLAANPKFEEIVMGQRELFNDATNEWHPKMQHWLTQLVKYFKDPAAFERERAEQK